MAFENLQPHHDFILGERTAGRTLTQLADDLAARHDVQTTAASLSRYLKNLNIADAPPAREPTPEEAQLIEIAGLVTEQTLAAQDHAETARLAIEHLAGKLAGMGSRMTALEEAVRENVTASQAGATSHDVDPTIITKIWGRAFLWVTLLWLLISSIAGGALWWWLTQGGQLTV